MTSPIRITAMRNAVISGNVKKVALLLKSGVSADGKSDYNTSFIEHAATAAQTEVFKLLVQNGAELNTPGLLSTAIDGDGGRRQISTDIVMMILDGSDVPHDELNEALRLACNIGNKQIVKKLIELGADVNGYDKVIFTFPLVNAVSGKHVETVKLLIEAGADPKKHSVVKFDEEGNAQTVGTLLDYAETCGGPEILALLKSKFD